MTIYSTRSSEVSRNHARLSGNWNSTSHVDAKEAILQGAQSGNEGASISASLQALSTNASLNRVLSEVLGPKEGSSNSAAASLNAAFSGTERPVSQGNAINATTPPSTLPAEAVNLMMFGGDRRTAVETLIASGAKAENPDLGFFKDTFRKLGLGGDKTASKDISADQTINTKVRTRNYNLLDLRLTTKGTNAAGNETRRHTDFETDGMGDGGWTAQVKDAGKVIAKGTPTRMTDQEIKHGAPGEKSEITNTFIDPKTGMPFLRTLEQAQHIETDKMGMAKSHKNSQTYRQIDTLGANGKSDQRYIFDYGGKSIRLESLDDTGQVTRTQALSSKTDYWALVDRLSFASPSAIPSLAPTTAPSPAEEAPMARETPDFSKTSP